MFVLLVKANVNNKTGERQLLLPQVSSDQNGISIICQARVDIVNSRIDDSLFTYT